MPEGRRHGLTSEVQVPAAQGGPPTTSVVFDVIPHIPARAKGPKPTPKPATPSDEKLLHAEAPITSGSSSLHRTAPERV
jgi:hypothetical protein